MTATIGQCKGHLLNEVAPRLDRRAHVGYIGDHDLAGGDIERNTRAVLERAVGFPLQWTRIAISDEQVEELRALGVEPIEKTDNRYADKRPHVAFEAEALGQERLETLVRDWLDTFLPQPLETVLEREERERVAVLGKLEAAAPDVTPQERPEPRVSHPGGRREHGKRASRS